MTVKDSGRGIAPEHLSTIFERFRQVETSTTRQHGGLQLHLVKPVRFDQLIDAVKSFVG